MSNYQQQVTCPPGEIDADFWRKPEGVSVPDDELDFLLVPDAVEALAIAEVAKQVHAYQGSGNAPITAALMATVVSRHVRSDMVWGTCARHGPDISYGKRRRLRLVGWGAHVATHQDAVGQIRLGRAP